MALQHNEMDHSDDDSYELIGSDDLHSDNETDDESYEVVESEEFRSRMNDIEELPSAGKKPQGNGIESSDPETDMEDKMDHTDADCNTSTDPEDFYFESTDSEKGPSAESEPWWNRLNSSYMEADDAFYMYGRFHFRTIAYQKADDSVSDQFPANIKRKEDMEIKDVVKDHVLPFLPAKSLKRFRTVSKEWDQWIVNPFLAHKQSCYFRDISGFFCEKGNTRSFVSLNGPAYGVPGSHLRFLPEKVVIRSSCNGLLLCQGCNEENVYYICNPANEEWHVLPRSEYYHGKEPNIVLVFEPSSLNFEANYQVICACPLFDGPIICFEIYSSETESWKCSTADCVELGNSALLKDNTFYMKGVAYWATSSGELLAFDVKNELCGIQPLPYERKEDGIMSEIDGELSYFQAHLNRGENKCIIEIFGGMNMCLKHSIAVDIQQLAARGPWGPWGNIPESQVLLSVNSNVLIILLEGVVYSYNVRDQKLEVICRAAGNGTMDRYIPYVNSLVHLPPRREAAA